MQPALMQIEKGGIKMENQKYVEPEMQIIVLDIKDVIAASGGGIELPDDEW